MNSEEWYDLGVDKYQEDDFDGALEAFQKAVEVDPTNVNAWFNLGVMYDEFKGDNEQAFVKWQKVLDLDPHHVAALYNCGNTLLGKEDYDGAIELFTRANQADAEFPQAFFQKGLAQYLKGDKRAAIDSWKRTVDVAPEQFPIAWDNIGVAHHKLGESQEGIRYCEKAVELAEKLEDWGGVAHAKYNIACIYAKLGQTDQAITFLKDAYEFDPSVGKLMQEIKDDGDELASIRQNPEFLAIKRETNIGEALAQYFHSFEA